MNKFLHWLTTFAVRIFTHIACRIDAPDLHKIPMQGPLIVIVNHTGQIEVPLLYGNLQPRLMTAWAKAETWENNWFLNWIFNLWKVIPIRRGEADINALKQALRALKDGYIFGIAPEGTRNKTGVLRRALPGTVIVALHSGVPILPVAHWGGEVFLSNLKRFKRTDFHIRVGEPFVLDTSGLKITGEIRQQIVDEMMYQIAALMPEKYRGEYADMENSVEKFIQKY
ncbi:MAG: 1-acyl-sn-glycerol-3-phosphate acyltransferase [Anaerolineales bacterium]|nr:1-acyl-sn-glycerol-3-phosphate acyltransferase [Anaerolineales bacterium]